MHKRRIIDSPSIDTEGIFKDSTIGNKASPWSELPSDRFPMLSLESVQNNTGIAAIVEQPITKNGSSNPPSWKWHKNYWSLLPQLKFFRTCCQNHHPGGRPTLRLTQWLMRFDIAATKLGRATCNSKRIFVCCSLPNWQQEVSRRGNFLNSGLKWRVTIITISF